MPMIEAALRHVPIFCSNIPPFREIAGDQAVYFELDEPPDAIAVRIAEALCSDPCYSLRRRVRRQYTWSSIYRRTIKPLIEEQLAGTRS